VKKKKKCFFFYLKGAEHKLLIKVYGGHHDNSFSSCSEEICQHIIKFINDFDFNGIVECYESEPETQYVMVDLGDI
jgi:hypothetical protein